MKENKVKLVTGVKFSDEIRERLKALMPYVEEIQGNGSLSNVIRLLVMRGIKKLEKEAEL